MGRWSNNEQIPSFSGRIHQDRCGLTGTRRADPGAAQQLSRGNAQEVTLGVVSRRSRAASRPGRLGIPAPGTKMMRPAGVPRRRERTKNEEISLSSRWRLSYAAFSLNFSQA